MPLDAPYDDANIFAKILAGDIPCHKVYEDEFVLAFMDVFPQGPGHTLVVPKVKARNLFDLPDDALAALGPRVKKVAKAVREALEPDGITIVQFNGSAAGQTVFHLHVHIIPRHDGVLLAGHGEAGKADDAVLAQHAAKIAAAIGSH